MVDGVTGPDGGVTGDGAAGGNGDANGPDGTGSDGTMGITDGNPGSNDATSGDASGSNDGSVGGPDGTGAPDVAVNRCPSAQTQFGFPAQGDANTKFTSGVGVRTASGLLIFDGFLGPDPRSDAGSAATVGLVYVQAFDPASANSLGAATPLFEVPVADLSAPEVYLVDVSIAPNGEIALLYARGMNNKPTTDLWAAFLSTAGDAGPAGVRLQRTVQIESVTNSGQHAIWSVANQAFVFSWTYNDGTSKQKVRKFFPDGASAGGDTNTVPENYAGYGGAASGAATSGDLLAVGWTFNGGGGVSTLYLTLLDPTGAQFGAGYVELTNDPAGADKFLAVGGTSIGFVSLRGDGATVREFVSPISGDAGVVGGPGDPLSDGGPFAGFSFASTALDAKTISEDPAGLGGVGATMLETNGVSFLYVKADGVAHLGPTTVFTHTYAAGDQIAITSTGGSFGVSLYDSASHSTQMAASGCR
jgi:hypothetical protein